MAQQSRALADPDLILFSILTWHLTTSIILVLISIPTWHLTRSTILVPRAQHAHRAQTYMQTKYSYA